MCVHAVHGMNNITGLRIVSQRKGTNLGDGSEWVFGEKSASHCLCDSYLYARETVGSALFSSFWYKKGTESGKDANS